MIDHAPHSTKVQDQAPPALSGNRHVQRIDHKSRSILESLTNLMALMKGCFDEMR